MIKHECSQVILEYHKLKDYTQETNQIVPAVHDECTSLMWRHQIETHQTYIHPATILHLKVGTLVPN